MTDPLVQVFVVRTRSDVRYRWRVVTRNRRELGRGTCAAESLLSVREDFALIRGLVESDALRPVLSSRPSEGGWRWALLHGNDEVAVSHRAYSRRRECLAPLTQFVELLKDPEQELRIVDLPDVTRRHDRRPVPPRPARSPLVERVRPMSTAERSVIDLDDPLLGLPFQGSVTPVVGTA